jgi:hypothetical protein
VPYRLRDNRQTITPFIKEVPQPVKQFQVGQKYRLPLWELVFHDCVVSYWYWADYNNKIPALWDKLDLFNILYGTPPMFMFDRSIWNANKRHFVRSYKNICTVARSVGYAEMTNHRFLTPDRNVQQTEFANGISVTVNFSDQTYRMTDGKEVVPMGYRIQ